MDMELSLQSIMNDITKGIGEEYLSFGFSLHAPPGIKYECPVHDSNKGVL